MSIRISIITLFLSISFAFQSCDQISQEEDAVSLTQQIAGDIHFEEYLAAYIDYRILIRNSNWKELENEISDATEYMLETEEASWDPSRNVDEAIEHVMKMAVALSDLLENHPTLNAANRETKTSILLNAGRSVDMASITNYDGDISILNTGSLCDVMDVIAERTLNLANITCFYDPDLPNWMCDVTAILGNWMLDVMSDFCVSCQENPPCF